MREPFFSYRKVGPIRFGRIGRFTFTWCIKTNKGKSLRYFTRQPDVIVITGRRLRAVGLIRKD